MVYSLKIRSDVFCFKLNFKISKLGYLKLNSPLKEGVRLWEVKNVVFVPG